MDAADVAALREAVPRSISRERFTRPPHWFVLRGGPLDGLRVPLQEYQQHPGSIIGWCTSAIDIAATDRELGFVGQNQTHQVWNSLGG